MIFINVTIIVKTLLKSTAPPKNSFYFPPFVLYLGAIPIGKDARSHESHWAGDPVRDFSGSDRTDARGGEIRAAVCLFVLSRVVAQGARGALFGVGAAADRALGGAGGTRDPLAALYVRLHLHAPPRLFELADGRAAGGVRRCLPVHGTLGAEPLRPRRRRDARP